MTSPRADNDSQPQTETRQCPGAPKKPKRVVMMDVNSESHAQRTLFAHPPSQGN
tara:strand:- start:1212 stop:1373 length:162 start_codon:yes stop_codon:yes gene_type:complete